MTQRAKILWLTWDRSLFCFKFSSSKVYEQAHKFIQGSRLACSCHWLPASRKQEKEPGASVLSYTCHFSFHTIDRNLVMWSQQARFLTRQSCPQLKLRVEKEMVLLFKKSDSQGQCSSLHHNRFSGWNPLTLCILFIHSTEIYFPQRLPFIEKVG